MQIHKTGKLILLFLVSFSGIKAQDTLKLNIQQADSIFLKNSFYLLAASMNIEAQKAQIIQAKLYPNPVFTADLNAYDAADLLATYGPIHSNLFAVGQQQFLLKKYNQQLNLLDSLLAAYQTQVDKGNIPLKELVRLKGAYLKLNNDRSELLKDYFTSQSILQTILQAGTVIKFEFSEEDIEAVLLIIS